MEPGISVSALVVGDIYGLRSVWGVKICVSEPWPERRDHKADIYLIELRSYVDYDQRWISVDVTPYTCLKELIH